MFSLRNILLGRRAVRGTQIRLKTFTVPCHLDEKVNADLENEIYKPKDHAGKIRLGAVEIPDHIFEAIQHGTDGDDVSQYIDDGLKLDRHLLGRHVPMEQREISMERNKIKKELQAKTSTEHPSKPASSEIESSMKRHLNAQINEIFYKKNYNWKPIEYTKSAAWAYLFGRAAKEYAVIWKIFNEIAKRDPEFKPRSFFDFGAGVGTGTWAASKLWKNSIFEYFLVDRSAEMNDLSELILRGGSEARKMSLKNVFYRQFLPASDQLKYHIVLSAFSLMELQNLEERLETLLTLWKKCDGYFIVIENGTNAGFQLIEEARTLILEQQQQHEPDAYIFSPCPHESPCPRVLINDGTPCNFPMTYHPLRMGNLQSANDGKISFSYIVFKKGSRSDDATIAWPRIVRSQQVRSGHVRCRLCTHRGELQEIVITKGKHSKYTYRCARKSDCGDRLPIEFEEDAFDSEDIENVDDKKLE